MDEWVNMSQPMKEEHDVDARRRDALAGAQDDLRPRLSAAVVDVVDAVAEDSVAVLRYSGGESLDPDYCRRVGALLVRLMASAIHEGRVDPTDELAIELYRLGFERGVAIGTLFTFVYLTERALLDELALHEAIGATSEAWPLVSQLVRRAAFDLLAAHFERAQMEPGDLPVVDRLTTLVTRPVFTAAFGRAAYAAAAGPEGSSTGERRRGAARHRAAGVIPGCRSK